MQVNNQACCEPDSFNFDTYIKSVILYYNVTLRITVVSIYFIYYFCLLHCVYFMIVCSMCAGWLGGIIKCVILEFI